MATSASEMHLKIQLDELRRQYDILTKRISALDTDIGRELDSERKLIFEERRVEVIARRSSVIEQIKQKEQELLQAKTADTPPDLMQTRHDWMESESELGLPVQEIPGITVRPIPPPPSIFVGRSELITRLTGRLLPAERTFVRVALHGLGGVGKTTLAKKIATELVGRFPGGILWLNAGPNASAATLLEQAALMMGVDLSRLADTMTRAKSIHTLLMSRDHMLIILDDLWDVNLGRWLLRAVIPETHSVLLTSREDRLCRELCDAVEHLGVLTEDEALELMQEYLGPLGDAVEAAREITRLTGALPLALQLAIRLCDSSADLTWVAEKLRKEPATEVLRLSGEATRDTSLETSLRLSYDVLGEDLGRRFRALGSFGESPFDLRALQTVWGDKAEDISTDAARELRRRGLVTRRDILLQCGDEPESVEMVELHTLLRLLAEELAGQAGELGMVRRRHASHYSQLMTADWCKAEASLEQIVHAWEWAKQEGDSECLDFYLTTQRFLQLRGHWEIYDQWTDFLILRYQGLGVHGQVHAKLLDAKAFIASARGDIELSLQSYDQALAIKRQIRDEEGQAVTLASLGALQKMLGHEGQAERLLIEALSTSDRVGDKQIEAVVLNNLGELHAACGRQGAALSHLMRALSAASSARDDISKATIQNNLGGLYTDLGRTQDALDAFKCAYDILRHLGDVKGVAVALNNLGRVHARLGHLEEARESFTQSRKLMQQILDRWGEASVLDNLAKLCLDLDQLLMAREYYDHAAELNRQIGDKVGEARCFCGIGRVLSRQGKHGLALEILQQALVFQEAVNDVQGEQLTRLEMVAAFEALGNTEDARAQLALMQQNRVIGESQDTELNESRSDNPPHERPNDQPPLQLGATSKPWLASYDQGVPHTIEYPGVTLCQMLEDSACMYPDQNAIKLVLRYMGPLTMGATLTYRQLLDQVNRFAAALADLGVKKDDRVALMLPNLPQFVISFYGALKLGAIVVNTNPICTAREIEHQFSDAGAETVVLLSAFYGKLKEVQANTQVKRIIVADVSDYVPAPFNSLVKHMLHEDGSMVEVPEGHGVYAFRKLLDAHPEAPPQVAVSPDDTAFFQYIGGTTGVSKAAMLSHFNLVANTVQVRRWMVTLEEGKERVMGAIPFCHVYGMTVAMSLAIYLGAELIVVPNPRHIDGVMKAIDKERATVFPGVPTMYIGIINHPDVGKYDLKSVKACISGAAPLPMSVQTKFGEITGGRLVEGYGLTEAAPVSHCNPIYGQRKAGSIGVPLPDVEAKIMDYDRLEEKPLGEEGELWLRGPQVIKGYWGWPNETAKKITEDGWLRTGDIARMDSDGYFYIVDHMKDIITAPRFNIVPREVEEVLFQHPKVLEAAVASVADAYRGETVKVYVVLRPGEAATADEIIKFCAERLAPYKVPKLVEFRSELPKSAVGKILRRVLVDEERKRSTN